MATESKQIAQVKLEEVQILKDLIGNHPVICLAKMYKLGTSQLQSIRKKLSGKIVIRMAKNRLFKIAAAQSKKENIKDFVDTIEGSTSYIFTNMNPFKLKIFLDENKVNAPAKGGDKAPKDIIVPEGNTGFPPGPMISEFKEIGIDSMVKGGSIYIKKDCVVAQKGEEISRHMSLVLSRLNISPMEIGLNLYAAYDDGFILKGSDLDFSLKKTLNQIQVAIGQALSLSLVIGYPTRENISMLLQKAYMEAKSLILSASIIMKETVGDLLAKATHIALSLSNIILEVDPNALPEELKEKVAETAVTEIKPTEEKKEEEEEKQDLGLGDLFG